MHADNLVADTTAPCSGWQCHSPLLQVIPCKFPSKLPHHALHTCTACGALQVSLHSLGSALLPWPCPCPLSCWGSCDFLTALRSPGEGIPPVPGPGLLTSPTARVCVCTHMYTYRYVCKTNSLKQFLRDILNDTRLA